MSDNWPDRWVEDEDEDPEIVIAANILLDLADGRSADDVRAEMRGNSAEEDEEESQDESSSAPASENNSGRSETPSPTETSSPTPGPSQSTPQGPANPSTTYSKSSQSSSKTPGSILPQGDHWKYKDPVDHPFGYRTAADASGGERTLIYPHPINFHSRQSVNQANKTRAREVYRARKRFDLPLARASMAGRQFTTTHFDWLSIAHEAYAMLHEGRLIPWNILTLWWRFCWRDGRTEQALRALHSRTQEFKDLRDGYQG